jgi:UDP-2-acetamido-3-amino-2,3-dideoxy-glucuronate N-acetyltransferase
MAVHPTAVIEPDVSIGRNTSIWDHVHVRHSTRIGDECIVGGKTYIAYGVTIGDRVKINAFVYICTDVTIESGVMIAAGTVFTNDRFPRATTPDLRHLLSSDPDENTLATVVRAGATIGAHATIGPGVTIGRFAMVGMGSVVTRDVPDFALVHGNPAKVVGFACACGQKLAPSAFPYGGAAELACSACNSRYAVEGSVVVEMAAT